ncbi:DUF6525 family protein [Salipiger mangrovisoli]
MRRGQRRNLGASPSRRRETDIMAAYDRLPPELRAWLAQAALPWSPRSALRAWRAALRRSGCCKAAAERLNAIEARQLAREGAWPGHP